MTDRDPTRPYWDDAARFPIGTRVRIHLSPEEEQPGPGVTFGTLARDPATHSIAHPPGSDGRVGTVGAMPNGGTLPGHTIYVRFAEPILIPLSRHAISRGAPPVMRCHGDAFAPTELEIIEESETS